MVICMQDYRDRKVCRSAVLGSGVRTSPRSQLALRPLEVLAIEDPVLRAMSPDFPEDLSTVDMEDFLGRVYPLATQI